MEVDEVFSDDEIAKTNDSNVKRRSLSARRRTIGSSRIVSASTLERVASSIFVLDGRPSTSNKQPPLQHSLSQHLDLPLSSHATLGHNSQFRNLTAEDRERLGGIEYRSLKLLLKIVTGNSIYRHSSRLSNELTKKKGIFSVFTSLARYVCLVGSYIQI